MFAISLAHQFRKVNFALSALASSQPDEKNRNAPSELVCQATLMTFLPNTPFVFRNTELQPRSQQSDERDVT